MNGARSLPIIRLFDTDFYLDLEKRRFQQVDNSDNSIAFNDAMQQSDHDLIYDPRTKNAFKGPLEDMSDRDDLVLLRLPSLVRQDIYRRMNRPLEDHPSEDLKSNEAARSKTTEHKRRRRRSI